MRLAGHVARMGERRGVNRVLVGKHEGKRPLGKPRRRWEDNIKMDLQEVWCGGIGTGGGRVLVNAVMNLRVPQNAENLLTSWEQVSFWRWAPKHGVSINTMLQLQGSPIPPQCVLITNRGAVSPESRLRPVLRHPVFELVSASVVGLTNCLSRLGHGSSYRHRHPPVCYSQTDVTGPLATA